MCVVAKYIQVTQFVPTIMMSLSLDMGIDYTLFLLARYLEDTSNQRNARDRMLSQVGHMLLFSGSNLRCTFLGLCFLPLQMLKSVGVGAAVSIGSALFVNLTLVPALLFTRICNWIIRGPGGSTVYRS